MDRYINNESLAVCSIVNLLFNSSERENSMDISRLDIMTILSVDAAVRKRMPRYSSYSEFANAESRYQYLLNRKYRESQTIFINALSLLAVDGSIDYDNVFITLTGKGLRLSNEMYNYEDSTIEGIIKAGHKLEELIKDVNTATLYKDLKIVL